MALRRRGYRVVGPSVRDGAVVYEELETAADLPIGWGDSQEAGTYRLVRRDDEARFGYAVGPHSWKQFLQPPHIRLWRARRNGEEIELEDEPGPDKPYAFVGVRGCDRHAIAIQDRVLLEGSVRRRRTTPRGAKAPSSSRSTAPIPAGDLLLRLDGHRARASRRASTSL